MKGCTRTLSMSNVVRRALEIAAPTNGRENERRPKKRRILGLSQAYGVFLDSLFPFPCPSSSALSSDRRRDFETREGSRVERVPLFIILERLMNHGKESDVKPLVRYPLANQTPTFS